MDESSVLLGTTGAGNQQGEGFLDAGQLYMFNPQPHFSRLTLCKTRSTNEPGVYIKRKTILAVVQRIKTWRFVYCAGFSGWINVADDQKDAGIFVRKENLKRYEDWKGNNLFFANGRIMIGSDGTAFTVTNVMASLVAYLFFWHVAPRAPYATIHTVSRSVSLASSYPSVVIACSVTAVLYLQAVGAVLIGTAMLNLWLTAFLEPGIIPRQPMHVPVRHHCTNCSTTLSSQTVHPFKWLVSATSYHLGASCVTSFTSLLPTSAAKPRSPNPITEPGWKYCTICNILRAPQVKHCTPCQVCVVGFDHHCPYTSNCVGKAIVMSLAFIL
jgi:hypothetical protein